MKSYTMMTCPSGVVTHPLFRIPILYTLSTHLSLVDSSVIRMTIEALHEYKEDNSSLMIFHSAYVIHLTPSHNVGNESSYNTKRIVTRQKMSMIQ
jgi:hypothetical protein